MKSYNQAVADANRRRAKHNHAKDGGRSKVYNTWLSMKDRCNNPNNSAYHRYGGRGITLCKRWDKFENFLADIGEPPTTKHTLDRINNSKGYSPSNVRWATKAEQANNRDTCVFVKHKGKTLNLKQWADELSMPYQLLVNRYVKGERGAKLLEPRRERKHDELVEFNGQAHSLKEWSELTGVGYHALWRRRSEGKPLFKQKELSHTGMTKEEL